MKDLLMSPPPHVHCGASGRRSRGRSWMEMEVWEWWGGVKQGCKPSLWGTLAEGWGRIGFGVGVFGVVTGDHHMLGEPRYAVLGVAG